MTQFVDKGMMSSLKRMTAGAVCGAVGAALALTVMERADLRVSSVADGLSLYVAGVMALIGAVMSLMALRPDSYRRFFQRPGDDRLDPDELRSARLQGLIVLLSGAMLAIPPLASAAPGLDASSARLAAAGVAVLFVAQAVLNWRVWRNADELLRRVSMEAGAAAFVMLQAALFLWASAEKLDLAPRLDSWTALTVTMIVYLAVGVWVSVRRGLGR